MKKFLKPLLLACIFISSSLYNVNKVEAHNQACTFSSRNRTEIGTDDNMEFVEFILNKEEINANDDNIFINYYDDGSVMIAQKLSDNEFVIYTPLTEEQTLMLDSLEVNSRSVTGALLWAAIMKVVKIYSDVSKVISSGCSIIEFLYGSAANPCYYFTQELLDDLAMMSETKWKVNQYIYKDNACPYPPNSAQCNQSPYAYTKTYLSRVF